MNKSQRIESLEDQLRAARLSLMVELSRTSQVRSLIEGQRDEQFIPIGSVRAALEVNYVMDLHE